MLLIQVKIGKMITNIHCNRKRLWMEFPKGQNSIFVVAVYFFFPDDLKVDKYVDPCNEDI